MTTIRTAAPTDIDAIARLWDRAGVSRPWNPVAADVDFCLAQPHARLFLRRIGETVIGSVMCGQDGHRGWIYYLAVDPDHSHQGHGTALLAHAEAWLEHQGCWKIQLMVRHDNPEVIGFYAARGYRDCQTVVLQKQIAKPG